MLGLTLVTDGVVVSVAEPVVKLNVPGLARATPPMSVSCVVVATLYVVFAVSPPGGVKVI